MKESLRNTSLTPKVLFHFSEDGSGGMCFQGVGPVTKDGT